MCLSGLEEQRLVALLQGSIETDDSPASGSDEEEGEEAQTDNFTEPIRFEAGRIVLRQSATWLLSQGKPLMDLIQKSC